VFHNFPRIGNYVIKILNLKHGSTYQGVIAKEFYLLLELIALRTLLISLLDYNQTQQSV